MSSSASSSSPLSSSTASSLIILNANQSDDLVAGEESAVQAWLMSQGFRSGEIQREKEFHNMEDFTMHAMARGCYKGELNVCKWLYDNGAAEDLTKATNLGFTLMHWACKGGHLSVCQWLFEVSAAGDITKADNNGFTPMHRACYSGHLSVCQWLFEVGYGRGWRLVQGRFHITWQCLVSVGAPGKRHSPR